MEPKPRLSRVSDPEEVKALREARGELGTPTFFELPDTYDVWVDPDALAAWRIGRTIK